MSEHIDILLVEDNEADIVLVREALKDAKVSNKLYVVKDGQAALDFLRLDPKHNPERVIPGLVLLDLYMPKKNGQEVLEEMKADDKLKPIPVVIMTSSQEEADITRAYTSQAASYVIKPVNFEQLTQVVGAIEDFWLSVVQLPKIR